ncbi:MAG: sigma-70 family RNA polymerase sigma factor [Cyanobacteria bacterium J06635_15]
MNKALPSIAIDSCYGDGLDTLWVRCAMPPKDPSTQAGFASSQTDTDLVMALRAGDTAALGALYDRHARLVYGIALKMLNNPQESEDLTHDIFLYLAKTTSYDPTRSSLRTFLAVITRSRAIDRLRSKTTRTRALQRQKSNQRQDTLTNPPLEYLFQREQSQAVLNILAQLSAEQREILQLMYYEGLTQASIAQRLNLPLTTVKARARRGLLKLRQIFKEGTGN